MKFIDAAKIIICSGKGGPGMVRFRREKYVPKGGPEGGNGGKGGNVVFRADQHMNTLLDFKYKRHFFAQNGDPGGIKKMFGKNGSDLIIKVPCGTLIKNVENGEILADLTNARDEFIALKGGKGGKGNWEFRSPTNQTPRYAEPGLPGEEMEVVLELKLIADVGIVGFPNAGKSTLVSTISAAKPKIADYPFTTLVPNLGIVKIDYAKNYTVADIPGLIEGAAEGKGLGIQFLRHVERTRVLLFLVEATSEDPLNDYNILRRELEKYNPEMLKKQQFIAVSKIDIVDEETKIQFSKLKFSENKISPLLISSVTHENIDILKFKIWDILEKEN
jgi:GTP-binding protein